MSKDWVGSNVSAFKMIGASNHCESERENNDFYATDPIAIHKLLNYESFNKNIWEYAVGMGHLSDQLANYGFNVFCSDIVNRGVENMQLIDFLKTNRKFDGDIITNPPYKYCSEFILKALEVIPVGNKVAMFLKLTTLEGQKRYEEIYSKYPPKNVYVFSKRIECAKNGKFKGESAVCYAWFIWEKGYKGETILRWIQ